MKKHESKVYRIYDYMKTNHSGMANPISNSELALKFNTSKREIRRIVNEINNAVSYEDFNKIIASCDMGYFVCTNEQEFKISIARLWAATITSLKRLKAMSLKARLDGQYKIQLTNNFAEVIETFALGEIK